MLDAFFTCDACRRELMGAPGQPTCSPCLADQNLRALADPEMHRRAAAWREERDRQERWLTAAAEGRRDRRLAVEQDRHDERLERREHRGGRVPVPDRRPGALCASGLFLEDARPGRGGGATSRPSPRSRGEVREEGR